uniref:Uncharacterized protein n=1 Tax=Arundo donax TaxID=35708 RepID=A0A0A9DKP6_ARUDO
MRVKYVSLRTLGRLIFRRFVSLYFTGKYCMSIVCRSGIGHCWMHVLLGRNFLLFFKLPVFTMVLDH